MKRYIFLIMAGIPLSIFGTRSKVSLKSWDTIEESDKEYIFKRSILISDLDLFLKATKEILSCEIPVKDFSRTVIVDGIKTESSLKSIASILELYRAKSQEIFVNYNQESFSTEELGTYFKCGTYFVIASCITLPIAWFYGSLDPFLISLIAPAGASAVTLKDYYQQAEDSEQIRDAMKAICARAKF